MKTPNGLKLTGFKKREARDRESARAWERDFSLAVVLSLSHSRDIEPRVFLKPVNFRHVWGFSVKTSRFLIFKKKGEARDREWPQRNTI